MRRASFSISLAVLLGCGEALAQPVPKITGVFPELVQRGASVEVTLRGEGLGSVTGLVFSGDSRLTATGLTRAAKAENAVTVKITIPADEPLGVVELRALSAGAVSGAMTLTVGNLPEIGEKSPNNSLDKAQPVTLPAAIRGVITGGTETDYYRFAAKKGQELVFDVRASRNGSPLDSSLAILSAAGHELARNEDARGFDSVLVFTVPEDGDYVVQLRDFQYRGGAEYKYLIFAGALPYVESCFPFGGQRGKTVELALFGRNLGPNAKITHAIPSSAPPGRQDLRVATAPGFDNLVPFDVQEWPDAGETEPNNTVAHANLFTAPVVINGRLDARKDMDRFKIKAAAAGKLICEVNARKFGSSLDALLILTDTNGAVLMQNNGAEAAEARLEFDAKKDAEYFLALRDLNDFGGPAYAYRLAIHPPSAAAAPRFIARLLPDVLRVHRDSLSKFRCEVTRQNGFEGPVRFEFENFPPGVLGEPLLLPAGVNGGTMLLSAAKSASLGSFPVKLVASGQIAGTTFTQTVAPANLADKTFREAWLTVLDAAPFALDNLTLTAAVDQDQSTVLEVLATRRAGFTNDIKLSVEGFSAGREPITKSLDVKEFILKTNELSAKLPLKARLDSELGTRPVIVRAEATNDGQTFVLYTRPVPLTVTPIPFVLSTSSPKYSVAMGGEAKLTIKAERRAGFAGEIALTFEDLPKGVQVEPVKIAKGAGDGALTLTASTNAVLGTNFSFTILGAGLHNDRNFKHRTGALKLSVTAPPMETAATNAVPSPQPK